MYVVIIVKCLSVLTINRYYSASTSMNTAHHCIGAATSTTILGPYTAQDDPLFCPLSQGGAIDASGYNDSGQRYIAYKVVCASCALALA